MKAKVLKEVRDKADFSKVYLQDSILEVTRERYQELKALGLVEEIRERVKQPEKEQ